MWLLTIRLLVRIQSKEPGYSVVGSASVLGIEGRMFESCYPDIIYNSHIYMYFFLIILLCIGLISIFLNYSPVYNVFAMIIIVAVTGIVVWYLGFEFYGYLFLIIYIGAIAVLFLFVVMMLDLKAYQMASYSYQFLVCLLGLILTCINCYILTHCSDFLTSIEHTRFYDFNYFRDYFFCITDMHTVGLHVYATYVGTIVFCGLLLLIGLIGAIVLTSHHNLSLKRQDIDEQIRTKFEKAITLTKHK